MVDVIGGGIRGMPGAVTLIIQAQAKPSVFLLLDDHGSDWRMEDPHNKCILSSCTRLRAGSLYRNYKAWEGMGATKKKGEITMKAVKDENFSPDPIDDARKILETYKKLPDNKKPMLMVIINALISGMEIQELLAEKQTI